MIISKDSAAKYLKNIGYEAEVVDGSVVVYISEDKVTDLRAGKILRKVQKTLVGIGYTASVGVKVKYEQER